MVESIRKDLFSICGERGVLFDEPLSGHTSFRIGGPADAFVMPRDEDQLEKVIDYCDRNEIPRFLLGNGTNILVADEGYRGTVIQIFKNIIKEIRTALMVVINKVHPCSVLEFH